MTVMCATGCEDLYAYSGSLIFGNIRLIPRSSSTQGARLGKNRMIKSVIVRKTRESQMRRGKVICFLSSSSRWRGQRPVTSRHRCCRGVSIPLAKTFVLAGEIYITLYTSETPRLSSLGQPVRHLMSPFLNGIPINYTIIFIVEANHTNNCGRGKCVRINIGRKASSRLRNVSRIIRIKYY